MSNEDMFFSIHTNNSNYVGHAFLALILSNTVYKPINYNDYKYVNDDKLYYILEYPLVWISELIRLGLVERKAFNDKFILSDKGFEFLLWMRKNFFEKVVRVFESNIPNKNYVDLLIKKEDIALVLSITRNPDKWKFLGYGL